MMVNLVLNSKLVLVVGGGAQATKRVLMMLPEGCRIVVASPECSDDLLQLARQGRLTLVRHTIHDESILDEIRPDILVAATNNHTLNRLLVRLARMRHILSYSASDPGHSDYAHVAVASMNGVRVAVSTGGASPAAARAIRDDIVQVMAGRIETLVRQNPRPGNTTGGIS